MAAASFPSMELQENRRLSVSKASASKISKLKIPSASAQPTTISKLRIPSAASPPTTTASSPAACQQQLPPPPGIAASSPPSRPLPKVVNADPCDFRRVVQALTGTPPAAAAAAPRPPSRLQRVAPPPLRTSSVRSSGGGIPHGIPPQPLLLQHQHAHQSSSTPIPASEQLPPQETSNPFLPPSRPMGCHIHASNQLPPQETPNPFLPPGRPMGCRIPASEQLPPQETPNPFLPPSLPMLSPHLLSPLPVLTPKDSSWATPIEAASRSPKLPTASDSSICHGGDSRLPMLGYVSKGVFDKFPPPLQSLPTTSDSSNCHGDGRLPMLGYVAKGVFDKFLTLPQMSNSAICSDGQFLSHLSAVGPQSNAVNGVLPPWSPTPLPYSPGPFPPSPAQGPPPATVLSMADSGHFNSHIKYAAFNPTMPNNFTL